MATSIAILIGEVDSVHHPKPRFRALTRPCYPGLHEGAGSRRYKRFPFAAAEGAGHAQVVGDRGTPAGQTPRDDVRQVVEVRM